MTRSLGRIAPTDDDHVRKYPLHLARRIPKGVPVVLGVNWYSKFDEPVFHAKSRRWWITNDAYNLGHVRGGHAVCLAPASHNDSIDWWVYYDQGDEGACVGFAGSRMMTLLNRERYDAFWLYRASQLIDEWPGEDYSGTSVRAAMDVLRLQGHRPMFRGKPQELDPLNGVQENRWATTVEEVIHCLGNRERLHQIGGVPMLNSWGRDYPHIVWIPFEVLDRLLREDGEATMVVDRT